MIKDIIQANENALPNGKDMAVLHTHFPQCFNNEGKFDIEKFKSIISESVDVTHEGYSLDFLGKGYAKLLASTETTTIIKPDLKHNTLPENENSENIYISGDNLDGLKHLLKSYVGKVKCIYIDPPYNTGSDGFVYNDNFKFTAEDLVTKLSISQGQADRILDLTKRGSASHSAWLMFMAARLQLARDLLTDDGVIFISIDDNEQANLKLLCDNIFGEENFEGNISVVVNPGGRDYKEIAVTNEYLLVFSKGNVNLNEIPNGAAFRFKDVMGGYEPRELRNRNPKYNSGNRPNLFYPFYVNPKIGSDGFCSVSLEKTDEYYVEVKPYNSVGLESVWRWGKEKASRNIVLDNIGDSQIIAKQKRDGKWNIYEKNRRTTTKIKSLWSETEMRTEDGTREMRSLFGKTYFDHPKPVDLISKCFMVGSNPGDIVIDFFSGSATSAQSVMQLNADSDEGGRNYILVQIQEQFKVDSLAYKDGYNTIDEIGIERIKRAAKKIKEETGADIDYGFKHYTLAEPSDEAIDKMDVFDPSEIFVHEQNILKEFGAETVLETWLVRDGYGFGAKVEELMLDVYRAYYKDKHLYLLDEEFTDKAMVALMDKYTSTPSFNPENIVVFGYSFSYTQLDMLKANKVSIGKSINLDIRY